MHVCWMGSVFVIFQKYLSPLFWKAFSDNNNYLTSGWNLCMPLYVCLCVCLFIYFRFSFLFLVGLWLEEKGRREWEESTHFQKSLSLACCFEAVHHPKQTRRTQDQPHLHTLRSFSHFYIDVCGKQWDSVINIASGALCAHSHFLTYEVLNAKCWRWDAVFLASSVFALTLSQARERGL